jgi:hypothetical protein
MRVRPKAVASEGGTRCILWLGGLCPCCVVVFDCVHEGPQAFFFLCWGSSPRSASVEATWGNLTNSICDLQHLEFFIYPLLSMGHAIHQSRPEDEQKHPGTPRISNRQGRSTRSASGP